MSRNSFRCSQGTSEKAKSAPVRHCDQAEGVHKQVKRVVLVMVDDDEDDCFLVEAALKEACFDCTFRCIQDGLEMMEYLHHSGHYGNPKAAPRPDLILLDLNMPRMNGRQVLEQLKADPDFRSIPVIVLTTSSEAEDVRACYDLGANSYIVKQSRFEGLLYAVNMLRRYWLDIATLPPRN